MALIITVGYIGLVVGYVLGCAFPTNNRAGSRNEGEVGDG
jgi:hypothetical protein